MNTAEGNWIDIAALEDIPPRGARVVKTAGGCIALFRTHDDQVFALDDACPHKGGPLSEGIVHDTAVTCPLHGWVIDLATGMARGAGAGEGEGEGKAATYRVRVKGGRILLDAARLPVRTAAA